MNQQRGKFVVFEGGDGSGKSTQANRIALFRRGLLTRQPGGTVIGQSIRKLLLSHDSVGLADRAEALLMAADRAQHVVEVIAPTLSLGRDVICDRYVASSIAYQGAGRQLGTELVLQLSDFAVQSWWPDLYILLDVPFEVSLQRRGLAPDRLEAQGREFHDRVRCSYLDQAAGDTDRWVVIDAAASTEEVSLAVDRAVHERLGWAPHDVA